MSLGNVVASQWCVATGRRHDEVEDLWLELDVPPVEYQLAERASMAEFITAVAHKNADGMSAAQNRLSDTGVLIISGLDLVMASLRKLEQASGKSAAEWCSIWATGIAAGAGVDDQ